MMIVHFIHIKNQHKWKVWLRYVSERNTNQDLRTNDVIETRGEKQHGGLQKWFDQPQKVIDINQTLNIGIISSNNWWYGDIVGDIFMMYNFFTSNIWVSWRLGCTPKKVIFFSGGDGSTMDSRVNFQRSNLIHEHQGRPDSRADGSNLLANFGLGPIGGGIGCRWKLSESWWFLRHLPEKSWFSH
jgi:hypothetical protein